MQLSGCEICRLLLAVGENRLPDGRGSVTRLGNDARVIVENSVYATNYWIRAGPLLEAEEVRNSY
jgi:hypothetical protein